MRKTKTIVDREQVSSDYIASRQNFGHVLSQVKNLKPPVWKTPWFYGPVGLALVAVVFTLTAINPTEAQNTTITTAYEAPEEINTTTDQHQETTTISNKDQSEKGISTSVEKEATSSKSVETGPVEEKTFAKLPIDHEELVEPQIVEKTAEIKNPLMLPHFNGVFKGEISADEMCSTFLACTEHVEIISFHIQYPTATGTSEEIVKGNSIPEKVCESIKKHSNGHMVFFTHIRAITEDGREFSLNSANFIATNS